MIEDWNDSEYCLEAVKRDECALKYALKFVKEQTPEICLDAIKETGFALKFVKEQTSEMCLDAIKETGFALKFVKEQNSEMCLEAIKETGFALKFVKEQTPLIIHYLKKYSITIYESFKKRIL